MKVYVSLTTIPSRVCQIRECIDSLLDQSVKPDGIFINVPLTYRRFREVAGDRDIPTFRDAPITIIRGKDYGPGTKLLSYARYLERNSLVVLVDDDCTYRDYMIETFLERMYETEATSCSFYTFTLHGAHDYVIGQAADGFAIRANDLDRIRFFYCLIKSSKYLFYHDDLWISFYLALRKVKIVSVNSSLKNRDEFIYRTYNDSNSLISLEGELRRSNLEQKGLRFLETRKPVLKFLINRLPLSTGKSVFTRW